MKMKKIYFNNILNASDTMCSEIKEIRACITIKLTNSLLVNMNVSFCFMELDLFYLVLLMQE